MDKKEFFKYFEGYDPMGNLPEGMVRVTAGRGGECMLVMGSEKTAIHDCGMAYCGEKMCDNIEKALNGRKLDYILLSHTHYDHLGGLPYVMRRFPEAEVLGSERGQYVLTRPGALRTMQELGENAKEVYGDETANEVTTEGMRVDRVLRDGDKIDLGDRVFTTIETKGHTTCSLAFFLEPDRILFSSESTGVLESPTAMIMTILTSYDDAWDALQRCRRLPIKQIYCPHYGLIPEDFTELFWDFAEDTMSTERDFIVDLWEAGCTEEEILQKYGDTFWAPERFIEQPRASTEMNARVTIRLYQPEHLKEQA